jgi:hypothetical protein
MNPMPTMILTEGEHYRLINGGPAFELTWDGLVATVNTVQSRTVVEIRLNGQTIFRALPPDQSGHIGMQTHVGEPRRR